jgi:hypothetical protein
LARKPEGMRPHGRSRHRWEHLLILSWGNKVGESGLCWSGSEGLVVSSCEHSNENSGSIKGRKFPYV